MCLRHCRLVRLFSSSNYRSHRDPNSGDSSSLGDTQKSPWSWPRSTPCHRHHRQRQACRYSARRRNTQCALNTADPRTQSPRFHLQAATCARQLARCLHGAAPSHNPSPGDQYSCTHQWWCHCRTSGQSRGRSHASNASAIARSPTKALRPRNPCRPAWCGACLRRQSSRNAGLGTPTALLASPAAAVE